MIVNKNELKEFLEVELNFYGYKPKFVNCFFEIRERSILAKHIYLLRKTEYLYNINSKLFYIYKMRLAKLQNKYSIHVPINTCDIGLRIMHIGPILINSKAKIGKNIVLHSNVSIVAHGHSSEAPVVGDNCILGVGAILLGNISLAPNIAVGAGAVVNKSFDESDIAIAGVPAVKISSNGRKSWNKR